MTAEQRHLALIQSCCTDRGATCIAVGPDAWAAVSKTELAGFQYTEHADNVALALKVCEELGVSRETALAGMQMAEPDPGALMSIEVSFYGGRQLFLVKGFAANDPESTGFIWKKTLAEAPAGVTKIALFNCRSDRPERSVQLAEAFVGWSPADHLVLMGSGVYLFAKTLVQMGFDDDRIHFADDFSVEEIFELLVSLGGKKSLIVGMGNIGGQGLSLVQHFKNRALIREAS